ncbi:DNA primase [Marinilabiliaceae bacterium JC040]|nr:DNA primase [Marinilabiliaceae bacterium JC040]
MIDNITVQKIFESAEIREVVSDFVTLKKRGVNYIGLCPFHNEKTPSFIVSPSKGIYKCFGCGKGGNAVNFVMEVEQLSYVEALKYLAKKYNIEIEEKELSEEEKQRQDDRESMLIVSKMASDYFESNLLKNEGLAIGLSYFKERSFQNDVIKTFNLGYCLDKWDDFTNNALKEGYKQKYLVDTGLTIESEKGLFDRFKGRVIFPIHSVAGKIIGFGGRTLRKDKNTAKYLNSPESLIYHKSKILYGIYQAKRQLVNKDKCYLVEGYTDVLSFHQSGIENVVASSGTSLTVEQIRLIKRFTNNITIIYDGDAAGIKASLRGIDLILEQGLNIKVLLLPDGEDPDSFAKNHSSSELLNYINANEVDFIVFKTKILLEDTKGDPILKARLITSIINSIAKIPDSILRSVYIKECSSLLKVKESVLYNEIGKLKTTIDSSSADLNTSVNEEIVSSAIPKTYECDLEEKELIRYILLYGDIELFKSSDSPMKVGKFIIDEMNNDNLKSENPLYALFFEKYSLDIMNTENDIKSYFRDNEDSNLRNLTVDILSEKYEISKVWTLNDNHIETEEHKLNDLVLKTINEYKYKKVELLLKQFNNRIKELSNESNSEELRDLLIKKISLQKVKSQLAQFIGHRTII